jgi:hypothetical protein
LRLPQSSQETQSVSGISTQKATLKSKRLAELENPHAIEIKCGFVDISDGGMAGV